MEGFACLFWGILCVHCFLFVVHFLMFDRCVVPRTRDPDNATRSNSKVELDMQVCCGMGLVAFCLFVWTVL